MATLELYIGGPPTKNYSQAMFPAVPFDQTIAPFNKIGVAAHKGPIGYADTRLLDFGVDQALGEFVRNNTIAQGDKLGVVLIPKNLLFMGFYYKVENPVVGLTMTPSRRVLGTAWTAIDCSVAAEGFCGPAGGALVTAGAVSMAGVTYTILPDMLDMTLTAYGAAKLGALKMTISPVMLATNTGGTR